MKNLSDWNYYWNKESNEQHRANLVYTMYISPDKQTLCMRFHRDPNYHSDLNENKLWTEDKLEERFRRELRFYNLAKTKIPVAEIVDVDEISRSIYLKWPGEDFYMMGYEKSYEKVLPDWKEQIVERFKEMWSLGIIKFSIHPNSWIIYQDGILRPINWFFSFKEDEESRTITDFLIQISDTRQKILEPVLKTHGWNVDTIYSLKELQSIALESFKKNYPQDLIDNLKKLKKDFHQ